MRIQAKLFILLLVIGLIPLAALSWRSEKAMQSLGRAIAGAGKAAAVEDMQNRLLRAVATSSDLMAAQQRQVELALRLLTHEVETRLVGDVPAGDIPLYSHTDFDAAGNWPPGTELAIDHAIASSQGDLQAIPISREHQSFLVAPGVDSDALRPTMRRLAGMDELYKRLSQESDGLFYWQYVTLENGLHTSFPGHGGYPSTYDPRQRDWYRNTVAADDVIWNPPLLDASTRRLLLTATMPIRGDREGFAGVTAIDVDVLSFLSKVQNAAQVNARLESFMVQLVDATGRPFIKGESEGAASLRVIASSLFRDAGLAWDARPETPRLEADVSTTAAITSDLLEGRDGIQRGSLRGRESLWVYGGIESLGSALLFIVPLDEIEGVADKAQDNVRQAVLDEVRLAGIASIALVVMIAGLAALAARTITSPLRELAATAEDLAHGNLDARAEVDGEDEVGELAMVFNAMVPELRNHIQVKESLALAREVQQKLLPDTAPRIPGFDIAGRSVYHDAVGGDYYDFIPLRGDDARQRIGIVVGDVSGHGIVAALTMTSVRALLRSFAEEDTSLLPVMRAVNRHIANDAAAGRFVTLVYLVLEPEARRLRWISAGHGPLLFYDRTTEEFEELAVHDIPLGVNSEWCFQENARDAWPARGILLIGTDGIWETRNPAGDAFGKDGLLKVIRANADLPAAQLCDCVVDALAQFADGAEQHDDITLVVVKFDNG